MENPPPLPGPKPLGRTFYILLLAPIAGMAVSAGLSVIGDHKGPAGDGGMMLSWLALLAMFVCSILCAIIAGKRWNAWIGVLMFVGVQIVYIGVACAGCATIMEGVNFH
jgi:hypothetical protein